MLQVFQALGARLFGSPNTAETAPRSQSQDSPPTPSIAELRQTLSVEAIVGSRLAGCSGATFFKSDPFPDTEKLSSRLEEILTEIGAEALPYLTRNLRSTTKIGDYNNCSYYDAVAVAIGKVKAHGFADQMATQLAKEIPHAERNPIVLSAVETLRHPATVPALLDLLLRNGSDCSPVAHYSREETIAYYVKATLSRIANENKLWEGQFYLDQCARLPELARVSRDFDKQGVSSFVSHTLNAFKEVPRLTTTHLTQYEGLLSTGLASGNLLIQLREVLEPKLPALNPELAAEFRFASLHHVVLHDPIRKESLPEFRASLSRLGLLSLRARKLFSVLQQLEQDVATYPNFPLQETVARLLKPAYQLALDGHQLHVRIVEPVWEKTFKKTPSSKDDPQAGIDTDAKFGEPKYVRIEPHKFVAAPARLEVVSRKEIE